MPAFENGQRVQFRDYYGVWYSGTIVEYDPLINAYVIDYTTYDYAPKFTSRTESLIRPA